MKGDCNEENTYGKKCSKGQRGPHMPRSSEPYQAALRAAFSERDEDDVAVVSAPAPPRDPAAGFCDCACTLRRLLECVVGGRRRTSAELRP